MSRTGLLLLCLTNTYYGPSDIRTLTAALFKSTILDATHQSVHYNLRDPSFSGTSATVDNTKPNIDTRERVLELAWEPVCAKLFGGVYPGTAS